jgi:Aminoglycoside-2''-adenylyltransferase
MDDLTARQLDALGAVGRRLDHAGIAYWVLGGWAVDFHLGRPTRAHDDVDIAVWVEDLPRISDVLEREGWRHVPRADDDGGTGYERGPVRLELTYLARDDDGEIFTPLRHRRAPWSEEALGDDVRELHGVGARVVSRAWLTAAKSSARDDPADAAKDRADHRALAGPGRGQPE